MKKGSPNKAGIEDVPQLFGDPLEELMLNILVDMPVDREKLKQLQDVPGVRVQTVPPREKPEPIPKELAKDANVLFCTFPPTNVEDCAALRMIQISSVGYSQVVNIGLAERGVRVCNAQGVFGVSRSRNRRSSRHAPGPGFHQRARGGVFAGFGYSGRGCPFDEAYGGDDRGKGASRAAANGFRPESVTRADYPRRRFASRLARGMDRRGGPGYTLSLPDAAGSPAVGLSECDYDAAYIRVVAEHALYGTNLVDFS